MVFSGLDHLTYACLSISSPTSRKTQTYLLPYQRPYCSSTAASIPIRKPLTGVRSLDSEGQACSMRAAISCAESIAKARQTCPMPVEDTDEASPLLPQHVCRVLCKGRYHAELSRVVEFPSALLSMYGPSSVGLQVSLYLLLPSGLCLV